MIVYLDRLLRHLQLLTTSAFKYENITLVYCKFPVGKWKPYDGRLSKHKLQMYTKKYKSDFVTEPKM
jgi:hypothetical protein